LAGLWLRTGAGRPRVWPSAARETEGTAANDAECSPRGGMAEDTREDQARCRFEGDPAAARVGHSYSETKGKGIFW
jgi:hypothetical protein